jgi:hypothetical protein
MGEKYDAHAVFSLSLCTSPPTSPMSQVAPTPSTSTPTSNFQLVFNAALERYENKTKNKLLTHPLANQLQSCDSPFAITSVLQGLVQKFDQHRSSDQRLTSWLNPTVTVLYAFSATLGEGIGLVKLRWLFLWSQCSDHPPFSGILTRKGDLCWYWCSSLGEHRLRSFSRCHCDNGVC